MYRVSLGRRVRDRVMFADGGETIVLNVAGDAGKMVTALTNARDLLSAASGEESTQEERETAAMAFASAMFGDEQARKLLEFYDRDCASVIASA